MGGHALTIDHPIHSTQVVTIPLRGYVFFGSAVRVLKAVKETVLKDHPAASTVAAMRHWEDDESSEDDEGDEPQPALPSPAPQQQQQSRELFQQPAAAPRQR